jgi:hypothetical protein
LQFRDRLRDFGFVLMSANALYEFISDANLLVRVRDQAMSGDNSTGDYFN